MKLEGYSQNKIAQAIGKYKLLIFRDLKQNCDQRNGHYHYLPAQRKADWRKREKHHSQTFTESIHLYVETKLSEGYSPEQIVGRAELEGIPCLSHETIYKHIRSDKKTGKTLCQHLRRKGRRHRNRGNDRAPGPAKDRGEPPLPPCFDKLSNHRTYAPARGEA